MNASENFAVSYVISRDSGSRHAGNVTHHGVAGVDIDFKIDWPPPLACMRRFVGVFGRMTLVFQHITIGHHRRDKRTFES